jgi:amino acid transporter
MCLGLGFERLVTIDILIYGTSLLLEFIALIVLRVREPNLSRPFKVPGGMFGAIAIGFFPMVLLGFSIFRSDSEHILGMSSLIFGILLIAGGFFAYGVDITLRPARAVPPSVGMD